MADRKAELERKKERLRQMREEKERRRKEKEKQVMLLTFSNRGSHLFGYRGPLKLLPDPKFVE